MADIYDNTPERRFVDGLKKNITAIGVKRVDYCIGYFNLRGWNQIADEIDTLPGDKIEELDEYQQYVNKTRYCRLLIGMHRPDEDLIRELYSCREIEPLDSEQLLRYKLKIAAEFKRQLMLGSPTNVDEQTLLHLADQLRSGKVCVKLYLRRPLHAKLYLAYRDDDTSPRPTIMGSSNLTYGGLLGQGELDTQISDKDNTKKLADWFESHWNDQQCLDITQELLKVIEESWAGQQGLLPYYIYMKTAYHLSQEARAGIAEYSLPPIFQRDLFPFQQNAVKIAVRHLRNERLNGAMIGDVVGLGKTITACAIAKMYETMFSASTLIICPANLQEMWKKYKNRYDLKADIISKDKPIDVDNMPYYKLVIIDESHNLRNRDGARYQNIKKFIEHQDCQVLLLSATPYNKDYKDLSNQLRLFLNEDADLGIRPENYIKSIGGEHAFIRNNPDIPIRSIRAFEKSDDPDDWAELMRLFLVRRTRTFIKENYAQQDADGRKYLEFPDGSKATFPDRIPSSLKFKTLPEDQYRRLYSDNMDELIRSLNLPRYGLSEYINVAEQTTASLSEKRKLENLSRAGKRMMGFCRSTFYKRMDSSGLSFLLTLYRHALRNVLYLYAIDNNLPLPIGDENTLPDDYVEDIAAEDTLFSAESNDAVFVDGLTISLPTDKRIYEGKAVEYYAAIQNKNGITWIDPKYFTKRLRTHLLQDFETIMKMFALCGDWEPMQDPKLNMLAEILEGKHRNDKVLVFTQYADTAVYIYNQLRKRGIQNAAYATGNSENPTKIAERFSPISNQANIPESEQYRIMIATDVLSEGQNLQDAHVIINYDLPWAIIRLIQRAGRVDRIGQKTTEKIYCYSFFPDDDIENVIRLRQRLNERINANAGVIGSDEVFFEGNEQNLRDLFNEKSGILDDAADDDVDLGSMAYEIWKRGISAHPELKQIVPNLSNVVFSTKKAVGGQTDSVITYARTYNDFDVLSWIDSKGDVISNSQKRILLAMACEYTETPQEKLENHHELVRNAVENIRVDNTTTAGTLGTRFSTRYRVWTLLDEYCNRPVDLLYTQEMKNVVKLAADDIYQYPLLESTKFTLGQMLRSRTISKDDIIQYIIAEHKNNQFCRVEENIENQSKEAQILCSLGIRN
jgi:superfamily II DNA or RNA helicase